MLKRKSAKPLNSGDNERGTTGAPAGGRPAVSSVPPAIGETMTIAAAAAATGEDHLSEGDLLTQCAGVIANGLESFLAMGIALAGIKSHHLYRQHGYASFEPYYAEQWGLSRARVRQLIRAAKVLDNLNNSLRFEVLPTTEGQIRDLAGLSPSDQIEVWQLVVDSTCPEEITAKAVSDHVLAFLENRAGKTADAPDPDDLMLSGLVLESYDAERGHDD